MVIKPCAPATTTGRPKREDPSALRKDYTYYFTSSDRSPLLLLLTPAPAPA